MTATITCICDLLFAGSQPSLAIDDWHCPRCGEPVTKLSPPLEFPGQLSDSDGLKEYWLYPQRDTDSSSTNKTFLFEVNLDRPRGHLRESETVGPTVELHEIHANLGWSAKPDFAKGNRLTRIQIVSPVAVAIPNDGTVLTLVLTGNFPLTTFRLRVFPTPVLTWSVVSATGIERSSNPESGAWRVLRNDFRRLTIELKSNGVYLRLAEPLDPERIEFALDQADSSRNATVGFRLLDQPKPGDIVTDSQVAKWEFDVPFEDAKCRTGDLIDLTFWPRFIARASDLARIRFEYEPEPVQFSPPNGLTVELFWGEACDNCDPGEFSQLLYSSPVGRLVLMNSGGTVVHVQRPVVSANDNPEVPNWLTVGWMPGQVENNGIVQLSENQELEIWVRLDLTRPPKRLPEFLSAEIRISNQTNRTDWTTRIEVRPVRQRVACPMPLIVDFGNTASFAAVGNIGIEAPGLADVEILQIHGGRPELPIPTRLAVNEFNEADPLRSEFVIGHDCEGLRKKGSFRIQSDLKRWISIPGGDIARPVADDSGRLLRIKPSVLVKMFLFGVIRRAEAMLRRYWMQRIVVTYPSKFRPETRDSLHNLIRELCDEVNRDPRRGSCRLKLGTLGEDHEGVPEGSADFADSVRSEKKTTTGTPGTTSSPGEPYSIDEANAIVTGHMVAVSEPSSKTVVASFDLGGGSLDTALVCFDCDNPSDFTPEFVSDYWGIGGFSDFGGDNVTVAVMELIKSRLLSLAQSDATTIRQLKEIPVPSDYHKEAGARVDDYELLWRMSEDYKSWVCKDEDARLAEVWFDKWRQSAPAAPHWIDTLKRCTNWPTLVDIYDHKIEQDHMGTKQPYSVCEKITKSIDEVIGFLSARERDGTPDGGIDYVVIGGRGSHLPLLRELIETKLVDAGKLPRNEPKAPHSRILFDQNRLKWMVAEGLTRAVHYCDSGLTGLARSGQFTSSAIGCMRTMRGKIEPCVLIPVCTRIDRTVKMDFVRHKVDGGLQQCHPWDFALRGVLTLYGDVDRNDRWIIGSCRLPDAPKGTRRPKCQLILDGAENRIRLMIHNDPDDDIVLDFTPLKL